MATLNNSPVLKQCDIIVQLFNNELLADIVFQCGDQIIYGHSLLLMTRSVVYESKFRKNQGVQKLIPIQKHSYKTFYEYIRFIYTDECAITKDNVMGLLKLSVKYKIPKLENMVIAYLISNELTFIEKFKVYEFCEIENYQLLRNWISTFIGPLVPDIIKSDHFDTIQPMILGLILNMDFMGTAARPVKEVDLFNALLKWINNHCKMYGIPLSQRRMMFDGLIRLIRFPIMVFTELTDCIQKSDNLFTDSDYVTFFKTELSDMWNCNARQVCAEAQKNPNCKVNTISSQRMNFYKSNQNLSMSQQQNGRNILFPSNPIMVSPNSAQPYSPFGAAVGPRIPPNVNQQFETTEKLIITGLRFISSSSTSSSLSIKQSTTKNVLLKMEFKPGSTFEVIVSFGESLELQPGCKYSIEIPNSTNQNIKTDLVHKQFLTYYKELKRDPGLVEIFFKKP